MTSFVAKGITKRFGGLTALEDVDIRADGGSVSGIIGPNGAGKSTFTNICTGLYSPDEGRALLGDEVLTGRRPEDISNLGVARTFQSVRLFPEETVLDNVIVAAEAQSKPGLVPSLLRTGPIRRDAIQAVEEAHRWLEFVGLGDRAYAVAGDLPAGSQRQLEVARALAGDPQVLFLDEPAAGLSEAEQDRLATCIRAIAEEGRIVMLIEHNMPFVTALCDTIFVLNFGRCIAAGPADEVVNDERVIEAYLGTGEA